MGRGAWGVELDNRLDNGKLFMHSLVNTILFFSHATLQVELKFFNIKKNPNDDNLN